MKVIQVLNTWEYFGAENVAIGICDGLRERGVDVAYASRIGSVEDVVRQHGIRYIGLKDVSVREVRNMTTMEEISLVCMLLLCLLKLFVCILVYSLLCFYLFILCRS